MRPKSISLAALAAVLLTSCGSSGAPPTAAPDAPAPISAPPSATAPAAAAKRAQAEADVARICAALDHYVINNAGRHPDSLDVLVTPDVNGVTYLGARALPVDPWNRAYVYEPPAPGVVGAPASARRVFSLGADGRAGGSGDDADIVGPAWPGRSPEPTSQLGKKLQANLALARNGRLLADIVTLESALAEYAINNAGIYPDSLEPLITPDVNGATYLAKRGIPKDPWGREYRYEPPRSGRPDPRVFTLGRDDQAGGTGEDADVDNVSIRSETPR